MAQKLCQADTAALLITQITQTLLFCRSLYNTAIIVRLVLTWFPNPPQFIAGPLRCAAWMPACNALAVWCYLSGLHLESLLRNAVTAVGVNYGLSHTGYLDAQHIV